MSLKLQNRVVEIFYSLSGEGVSVGTPTIFVRLAGCSLRCGKTQNLPLWCDTPYGLSYKSGTLMNVKEVMEQINIFTGSKKFQILVTGGEPLEKDKKKFTQAIANIIHQKNKDTDFSWIRVETNGKESIAGLKNMVFSIDYKLPGSGMERYMDPKNFITIAKRKNPLDEVKFVVRNQADYNHSLSIITKFHLENLNLVYSPVHTELNPEILAEWIKATCLPKSRLSLQLHKILWGNIKGV